MNLLRLPKPIVDFGVQRFIRCRSRRQQLKLRCCQTCTHPHAVPQPFNAARSGCVPKQSVQRLVCARDVPLHFRAVQRRQGRQRLDEFEPCIPWLLVVDVRLHPSGPRRVHVPLEDAPEDTSDPRVSMGRVCNNKVYVTHALEDRTVVRPVALRPMTGPYVARWPVC